MANVLHKVTFTYKRSVNTPEYMDGAWLINPDPTIIATVPKQYWKIVDEELLEMNSGEKVIVDDLILPTIKIAKKVEIARTIKQVLEDNFPPEKQRTLFHLMQEAKANGLTNRLAYLAPLWTWMKQGITLNHNKDDAVDVAIDADAVAAVTLNLSAINTSVPTISIRDALAIVN